ncbi:MAG: transporter substrate-binding domain-containing protein, partial [Campylobacter sp.]|nr:transporter substrate-binding domain-containing protein [Campylobacter sp.]
LKQNDDLVEFFKEPDGREGFSFAFDKGKYPEVIAKFNAALDEVKKDGTYDKLLEKYNLK